MGLIRNVVVLGLGYLAIKAVKHMLANVQAQQEKVKARANDAAGRIPKLKLDPVTGVYSPEV
jgi:hypothetical protein